jgi:tetratricopeptide (TPR) repeat protein
MGRDAYMMSVTTMTPEVVTGVVKLLLDGWTGQLPPPIERGLLQLYSTIEIDGTRIRVGAVPVQKDRDWVRAHLFAVHPDYSGKLRVLLANLSRGVERDVAYRNAFAQTADEIERAVDRYMAAGQYGTVPGYSRPLNPRRELMGREVEDSVGQLALADLQLANNTSGAGPAYESLLRAKPDMQEAQEGPGLLAIREGRKDQALQKLKGAVSAWALLQYAEIAPDTDAKRSALQKAAAANKRWAEPHRRLAKLETHPAQKLAALRKAAELDPRAAEVWIELAELQENAGQFPEAAKSWAAAERTTDDPNERNRIRQRRLAGEKKRVEAQIAAREEARRKTEEELQALRNKALLDIRAAEARANAGKPVIDPSTLDEYKEGPSSQKISGTLTRVECLGTQARLHVTSGRQTTRLLVADPGQVALSGGGQISLTCGVQRPGRAVTVEYQPRKDAGQGIAGDALTVEFTK